MTPALIDVRLVLARDGRWAVSMEGRRVLDVDGDRPSSTLTELARVLDATSSRTRRAQSAEATDPRSSLFVPRNGAELVEALRARPAPADEHPAAPRPPGAPERVEVSMEAREAFSAFIGRHAETFGQAATVACVAFAGELLSDVVAIRTDGEAA